MIQRAVIATGLTMVVVGGALLLNAGQEGETSPGSWRLCDTVLPVPAGSAKKGEIEVRGYAEPVITDDYRNHLRINILKEGKRSTPTPGGPPTDPPPGRTPLSTPPPDQMIPGGSSSVVIDARTGKGIDNSNHVRDEDQAAFEDILNDTRVEELDPREAGWPYSEASPFERQIVSDGIISYRRADPTTGLMIITDRFEGEGVRFILTLVNCRSQLQIKVTSSGGVNGTLGYGTLGPCIVDDDRAAFRRFLDEVGPGELGKTLALPECSPITPPSGS
jgi:hypothetical protein